MRALVTGGTGFVGSHLIERLVADGMEVRALIRRESDRAGMAALGAEAVIGNLDDADSLHQACIGVDVVYHAAARVEIVGSEADFMRTTVEGTRRLCDAAAAAHVKRFVYVSSCGVYHPKLLASGVVINEATPTPEPPRWFMYGRTKLLAEEVVRTSMPSSVEWTVIRLGYLYGPRNRTMHTYLAPVFREGIARIVGNGDNEMAMVYVADAVKAIALAGTKPAAMNQILIAGGNERVTQQTYFDSLADGFGLPRVKRVPYGLAFFAGWIGEYVAMGTRRMVMRRAAVALTGLPQRIDCTKTQDILNWKPTTRFADGMRRAFEWYDKTYGRMASQSPSATPSTVS